MMEFSFLWDVVGLIIWVLLLPPLQLRSKITKIIFFIDFFFSPLFSMFEHHIVVHLWAQINCRQKHLVWTQNMCWNLQVILKLKDSESKCQSALGFSGEAAVRHNWESHVTYSLSIMRLCHCKTLSDDFTWVFNLFNLFFEEEGTVLKNVFSFFFFSSTWEKKKVPRCVRYHQPSRFMHVTDLQILSEVC